MTQYHRNANINYRFYIQRAHALRAQAFSRWLRNGMRLLGNPLMTVLRARSCRRQRLAAERELYALDDRMLKDIGLSRSQIGFAVDAAMPPECGQQEPRRSDGAAAAPSSLDFVQYKRRATRTANAGLLSPDREGKSAVRQPEKGIAPI